MVTPPGVRFSTGLAVEGAARERRAVAAVAKYFILVASEVLLGFWWVGWVNEWKVDGVGIGVGAVD